MKGTAQFFKHKQHEKGLHISEHKEQERDCTISEHKKHVTISDLQLCTLTEFNTF